MKFAILAHAGDETALGVYAMLWRRHGGREVRLVAAEELAMARFTHEIVAGRPSSSVCLSDGAVLDDDAPDGILNRLIAYPGVRVLRGMTPRDQDYASMEANALWLSWLAGLRCPVLNRPTARSLWGPDLGPLEWRAAAGVAGLPVRDCRFATDRCGAAPDLEVFVRTAGAYGFANLERAPLAPGRWPTVTFEPLEDLCEAIVAGDRVVGAPDDALCAPLMRFARSLGTAILGVTFGRRGRQWKVAEVTALPAARDREAVTAVADALEAAAMERV